MHKTVYVLLLLMFVTACEQQKPDNSKPVLNETKVPGWVVVLSGLTETQLSSQKGKLAQTYDEFIGGLIDDGLRLTESVWYKPTYGNQNILLVKNRNSGQRMMGAWIINKKEFSSTNYEFKQDKLTVNNVDWQYAGYSDNTTGEGSKAYNAYAFVCGSKEKGVSVFYWGDGLAISPVKNESVMMLLSNLTAHCTE